MRKYRLLPQAEVEYEEALDYFLGVSVSKALHFADSFEKTLHMILRFPLIGSIRFTDFPDLRFYDIDGYDYSFMYNYENDMILIAGLAHQSRKPGYWME